MFACDGSREAATEIPERVGWPTVKVRLLLEAQGFFPLSGIGPRRCRKVFFERTEQSMAALESLGHNKKEQLELGGVGAKADEATDG